VSVSYNPWFKRSEEKGLQGGGRKRGGLEVENIKVQIAAESNSELENKA
jgi:hypothetical protein